MFPLNWVTDFINSGMSTSNKNLHSIKRYMTIQEALGPPSKEKPKHSTKAMATNNSQGYHHNNNSHGAG
jgi:hypothetical protein